MLLKLQRVKGEIYGLHPPPLSLLLPPPPQTQVSHTKLTRNFQLKENSRKIVRLLNYKIYFSYLGRKSVLVSDYSQTGVKGRILFLATNSGFLFLYLCNPMVYTLDISKHKVCKIK